VPNKRVITTKGKNQEKMRTNQFDQFRAVAFCQNDIAHTLPLINNCVCSGRTVFLCGDGENAKFLKQIKAVLSKGFSRHTSVKGKKLPVLLPLIPVFSLTGAQIFVTYCKTILSKVKQGDVVIFVNTSETDGKRVAEVAKSVKAHGAVVIYLTNLTGNTLRSAFDACICVPSFIEKQVEEYQRYVCRALSESIKLFEFDM